MLPNDHSPDSAAARDASNRTRRLPPYGATWRAARQHCRHLLRRLVAASPRWDDAVANARPDAGGARLRESAAGRKDPPALTLDSALQDIPDHWQAALWLGGRRLSVEALRRWLAQAPGPEAAYPVTQYWYSPQRAVAPAQLQAYDPCPAWTPVCTITLWHPTDFQQCLSIDILGPAADRAQEAVTANPRRPRTEAFPPAVQAAPTRTHAPQRAIPLDDAQQEASAMSNGAAHSTRWPGMWPAP